MFRSISLVRGESPFRTSFRLTNKAQLPGLISWTVMRVISHASFVESSKGVGRRKGWRWSRLATKFCQKVETNLPPLPAPLAR
jgi:hypothetical protein